MAITNLAVASSTAIKTALSNMRGSYNAQNAWINAAGNKYIIDTRRQMKTDFQNGNVDSGAMTDYIASSICIHCFNGWSYLSAAVNSLLDGDYGNAIHNAYYAELRSMMSFLATQGIGVFDRENVLIDPMGVAVLATPAFPTHVFAKSAFDQWLKISGNAESLLKLLVVENYPVNDWLNATGFPPASEMPGYLARKWLKGWSMDLDIIGEEKELRNFVSYRPQCFDLSFARQSDNMQTRLQFIVELWKICSPNKLFDYSILRNSLEVLYSRLFNTDLISLDIEKDWKANLARLGMNPNDQLSQYIIKFFRREIEPQDNQVFDMARNITFPTPVKEIDTEPMGIISRACLLLLMTTKVIESFLRQTGTSRADLQFWHSNIGLKSGFWDSVTEPALFSDLWADVEGELEEVNRWVNSPGKVFSPYNFQQELKAHFGHARQLNKAYLWGTEA
jgi:hypothetical protein